MSHKRPGRQRPLFHDSPDWDQLGSEVRAQVVWQLAEMCLEILEHRFDPSEDDQETT